MVADRIEKVKEFIQGNSSDLYVAALIFCVGIASFGLGRLWAIWPEKKPVEIIGGGSEIQTGKNNEKMENVVSHTNDFRGKYVASKSGTSYHFPWCAGASKIKESNKIWFGTKEEAEAKGYKPAGNCEGL